jgi:hypothetical protein
MHSNRLCGSYPVQVKENLNPDVYLDGDMETLSEYP